MAARFNDYRAIQTRFNSTGTCGHAIRKGDSIGWAPRTRETQCADCWSRWVSENAEAERYERQHGFCGGGYEPC